MPFTIYPERRHVTEAQVRSWYADHKTDEDGGAWKHYYSTVSLQDAMEYLEDIGVATFRRVREDG